MHNKFSKFGYFSLTNETNKQSQNITEIFNLNNGDCAAVILCSHDGIEVSKLILDNLKTTLRLPAFTDLSGNLEIKTYLENIFVAFDKKYLKDADQYLRKRSTLNERLSKVELSSEIEDLYKSLEELERISKCGCTLSLAILLNDRLYIGNIGDNQVIVAMDDELAAGEHKFLLLTEEHNIYNENEIQRIKTDCELNANGLRNLYGKSYTKYHSRCLGHYEMKCEYMQFETFRHSKASPLTAAPQITDGLKMNSKWCHLLLVSSGLYYLVMELIYDRDKIAGEIANEFVMTKKRNSNKDLSEISELVIKKYLDIYKAAFDENSYNKTVDNIISIDHGELTIMAIKLSIADQSSISNFETDSVLIDQNGIDMFVDNHQTSNFTFPYVSFDLWHDAETTLTSKEVEQFDSIFVLSENPNNFILEEESNSSSKFSRATTLDELILPDESNSSNDKNAPPESIVIEQHRCAESLEISKTN